jgi:ABC-type antimicrobial peptide transport system permease subunit
VDPELPISEEMTMVDGLQRSFGSILLARSLFVAIAAIAVTLTMIGLYGVLAFVVAQRNREMGIRVALGAPRRKIVGLVVREAVGLAAVGVVLGLIGAIQLTRSMASLLYGVRGVDVTTLIVVSVSVILLALFAAFIPAQRAAKIDPLIALRHD